jgi:hypothetical protein
MKVQEIAKIQRRENKRYVEIHHSGISIPIRLLEKLSKKHGIKDFEKLCAVILERDAVYGAKYIARSMGVAAITAYKTIEEMYGVYLKKKHFTLLEFDAI